MEEILEKILSLLKEGGKKIVIYGEPGSGRSYLIERITKEVSDKKIKIVSPSLKGIMEAMNSIKDYDIFVIDDVDLILNSDVEVGLKELFKKIEENGKSLVVVCEKQNLNSLKSILRFDAEFEVKISFDRMKDILEKFWGDYMKYFSEKDLKKIYENSGGNIKLAHMIAHIIWREKRRSFL